MEFSYAVILYKILPLNRYIFILVLLTAIQCKYRAEQTTKGIAKDKGLRILVYGLGDRYYDRALNTVAGKYGFSYLPVAGCVVTPELRDSVFKENNITYSILEQKFGQGWRSRFEVEVDTMYQWQKEVQALVENEKYIADKKKELGKADDELYYAITPATQINVFNVNAYSWTIKNDKHIIVVYYKLSVDLKNRKINVVNSTPEKLNQPF